MMTLLWGTMVSALFDVGALHQTPVLCVQDAATGAPLTGAHVSYVSDPVAIARDRQLLVEACGPLTSLRHGDHVTVARLGYRPQIVTRRERPVDASRDTLVVSLVALSAPPGTTWSLETRIVTARRNDDATTIGRTTQSLDVSDARAAGAGTVNGMIAMLPYVSLRSARGETGLSLRGSRREQVAITLDGLPLNDPATGIADVSDVPLASVRSVTVQLGADPVATGSGASGGVLALTTGRQRVISTRLGAFGQRQLEAAWGGATAGTVWHASAAWRDADNDYGFVNDAGAESQREVRVNNDEQRLSLSAGVLGARAQFALLGSTGTRGMVGAANVRAFDADRARTDRLLVRTQFALRGTQLLAGARWFALEYRDPVRPALDARARASAADLEWRGAARHVAWRVGGGADQLRGTGGVAQSRWRSFLAADRSWASKTNGRPRGGARTQLNAGLRLDVIEGQGALPTFSLAGEHRVFARREASAVTLTGRVAQAVRVPTLYDLYFSSPQRLFVRTLAPERVTLDASAGARTQVGAGRWTASSEASLVARNTRDAIVWFPGNFGFSPANVGVERLRGAEGRAELRHARDARSSFALSSWVTAYRSTLVSGDLLIPTPYVPRVAGGGQVRLEHGARVGTALLRAMGQRPFTAGPRNPAFELPQVALLDLSLAQQLPWQRFDALVTFAVENVTNVAWQSVRGFPSPGRSWAIAFTLRHSPP